jgi:hypothetical protein
MSPAFCIPVATGVPYAPGPPDWWVLDTSGHDPTFDPLRKLRDDPRWRGAARISIPGTGVGTGDLASFRALRTVEAGQPYLYLGFTIYQDLELDGLNDRVWLCAHRDGGKAYRVRIATGPDTGTFEPHAVGDVYRWESTAVAPLGPFAWAPAVAGAPTWVAQTARAWVRPGEWAIHVRVPLTAPGAGLDAGVEDGSRIALLLQDWVSSAPGGVVPYAYPAPDMVTASSPNSTGWAEIRPEGDPLCQGVAMELFHVDPVLGFTWHLGTTNTPSSLINAGAANTFLAMPTNKTAAPIPANQLSARFRIANWGSSITGLTGPWQQIIPDPNVPGTTPPTNPNPIPPNPPGGGPTERITGSWSAPPAAPGTTNHQCVLVELSGPVTFLSDSVVRNMDIVQASEFERPADISVEGLGPLDGPKRTVYLYVDAENLPAQVPGRPPPPDDIERLQRRHRDADGDDGEFPPEDPPTLDDVASQQPSYRVYAFHETGQRWRFENQDAEILEPQSSFGFLVEHSGPLYGWEHSMGGSGLRRIAPDLYRLKIPNDGVRTVRTRITALERKPQWWRRACLVVLALLAALAALVWRALRR